MQVRASSGRHVGILLRRIFNDANFSEAGIKKGPSTEHKTQTASSSEKQHDILRPIDSARIQRSREEKVASTVCPKKLS